MASDREFVAYVSEQMSGAGMVSSRKMFGEYAIYCDAKVVALVCDNQLFIKPTAAGKALLGTPIEARPFPEAKPWFLMDDGLDDHDFLAQLIATTARDLPAANTAAKPARKPRAKTKARRR